MKHVISALFLTIMLLSMSGNTHATLIHYSVNGQMAFAETNWDNYYTAPLYGDMYISDINLDARISSNGRISSLFEINSFAINAGAYGWGGTGTITSSGNAENRLYLNGTGDWNRWEFGEEGRIYDGYLPEIIDIGKGGWGWNFGDDFFSRVMTIVVTESPAPVPEPSIIILLGAGLGGLVFWRRRTDC